MCVRACVVILLECSLLVRLGKRVCDAGKWPRRTTRGDSTLVSFTNNKKCIATYRVMIRTILWGQQTCTALALERCGSIMYMNHCESHKRKQHQIHSVNNSRPTTIKSILLFPLFFNGLFYVLSNKPSAIVIVMLAIKCTNSNYWLQHLRIYVQTWLVVILFGGPFSSTYLFHFLRKHMIHIIEVIQNNRTVELFHIDTWYTHKNTRECESRATKRFNSKDNYYIMIFCVQWIITIWCD